MREDFFGMRHEIRENAIHVHGTMKYVAKHNVEFRGQIIQTTLATQKTIHAFFRVQST